MHIGCFTKIFQRPRLEDILDAVTGYGLQAIQLNLESAGGLPMPDRLEPSLCERIQRGVQDRGLVLAAVSGTFNIIHPDPGQRDRGFAQLRELAGCCSAMGAPLITFSTGTRNPDYMWGDHPNNGSSEAWSEMLKSMEEAVRIAESNRVALVFEPEVSNVVDSAVKARKLLDHFESEFLKVLLDGANLFHAGQLPRMREILDEAFQLLGPDIRLAHAKDLVRDGEAGNVAAGTGLLDYQYYLCQLHSSGFAGSLILHSIEETQLTESKSFLETRLSELG